MENNLENAVGLSAELLGDIPDVHAGGKHAVAIVTAVAGVAGVTCIVAYGVYRFFKGRRERRGIIDGEILGVEESIPEE